MNRTIVCIAMLIVAMSAYSVFQIKYKVKELTKDLIVLNRQVMNDRQAVHVLEAEWAYLTQPKRLKKLTQQYLGLQTIKVSQLQELKTEAVSDYKSLAYIKGNHSGVGDPISVIPTRKPLVVSYKQYE